MSITSEIFKGLEKIGRQFEPNPTKRNYYRYLDERVGELYKAVYSQDRLLGRLQNPSNKPTIADYLEAKRDASTLADFGLKCRMFDDFTYFQLLKTDGLDKDDIGSVTKLINQIYIEVKDKGEIALSDLSKIAALSYHLQTLKWLESDICPPIHSPYSES